jgi:hypothetical protein
MEERIIAAYPVADRQGYRRELLALLGDDDPAQVPAADQLPGGHRRDRRPARAHHLQLEQTVAAVRR